MSARFFLDTNVFVYSFDATAPRKASQARQLIREAIDSRRGIVSYQIVQEFFNVALRRFAVPMALAETEQYLSSVFRPLLAIHSSSALYAQALQLTNRYSLSWYDSLVVASAIEAECAVLYTEDLKSGQRLESLKIENPFA